MKLLLIHLSDIHITGDDDVITGRHSQIVNAVKNLDYSLDLCVVVVTGDIAFSGTDEQYLVAFEFFENTKQLLSDNLSGPTERHTVPVHLIIVPATTIAISQLVGSSENLSPIPSSHTLPKQLILT